MKLKISNQMVVFICIVFGCFITIISAYVDLRQKNAEQKEQIETERKRNREYEDVIKKSNTIIESLGNANQILSGGNSFCYFHLSPMNDKNDIMVQLIHKSGDNSIGYPLSGVRANLAIVPKSYKISMSSFYDSIIFPKVDEDIPQPNGEPHPHMSFHLGDIKIGLVQMYTTLLDIDLDHNNVLVKFTALNGLWTELYSKETRDNKVKYHQIVVKKEAGELVTILDETQSSN